MPIPQQLGRYRVEKEIGQGAMGRVLLGHDPAIDRRVALKIIHMPAGLSPSEREQAEARFLREVRAAGRLSHPHIVTVFDVGQDPVFGHFVAMEYVEGPTFDSLISSGRLPAPRVVVSVACQAADALHYAHQQGIVHRDIKPANLILVDGRSVKITDFGLAKPEGAALTRDGAVLGTPYYMSPEQVKGGPVDGRSDLFSLGVVVYEMLTGKRPFRGDAVSTVLYRILHEPPVAPDPDLLAAAEPVKAFLARALAKDPDRRFADGDAFARALREAFSGLPAAAGPPAVESASARSGTAAPVSPPPAPRPARPAPERQAMPVAGSRRKAPSGPRPGRDGRSRPASVAAGTAARKGRRRAGRRQRRISLAPVAALFVILTAVAWIFRDDLSEWGARALGLPVATAQPETGPPIPAPGTVEPERGGGEPAAPETGREAVPRQGMPAGKPGGAGGAESTAPASGGRQEAPGQEAGPVPGGPSGATASSPRVVRIRSEPPGAAFTVDGERLEGSIVPAPEGSAKLRIAATLGCRSGEREVAAADAGSEVVVSLEAGTRQVAVHSRPEGASLAVDGEKRGETPATVALNACEEHELSLTRSGFERLRTTLGLEDGVLDVPERLDLTLTPLPRGTVLAPRPPYPVIMELSGQRLDPGEKLTLVADTYRFRVRSAELLLDTEVKVRVPPDRQVTPDVEFPPVARFNVLAAPSNVELVIESKAGRRSLGAPPVIDAEVVAGTYTVTCTFRHNGEKQEKTVTLVPGENPPIKFVAERTGGG